MSVSKRRAEAEQAARSHLIEVGRPPQQLLRAVGLATDLSLDELGVLVSRSAFTVRRWTSDEKEEIVVPSAAACALEDLRTIVAMLVESGHSRRSITSFLRSRNPGLGRDRPLDGLRSDVSEFARVEHVTQCFIDGIAPEQGRHVLVRPKEDLLIETMPDQPVEPRSSDSGDPSGLREETPVSLRA